MDIKPISDDDMKGFPVVAYLELRVGDTRIVSRPCFPQEWWDEADFDQRVAEVKKGLSESVAAIFKQIEQKDLFS